MRIYNIYNHFKELSKVRYWSHKFYYKAYSNKWEYQVVTLETDEYPRLFKLIKRK